MMNISLFGILVSLLFLVSCSSTERLHYYKVTKDEKISNPKISYHVESIHQSLYGRTVSLIYKRRSRLFQVAKVQHVLITVKNIASKTYTIGPLFVPVVPYFITDEHQKLNKEENLQIDISAYSDPEFEQQITSVPELEIVTSDLRTIKASSVVNHGAYKQLIYNVKIKDLPYFLIKEAIVSTDKGTLKIPSLKFKLTEEFNYECCISIAP